MYIPLELLVDSQVEQFKAKFDRYEGSQDYLYYPSNADPGIRCTEALYNKYVSNFIASFKINKRIMLIWFLLILPLMVIAYIAILLNTDIRFGYPHETTQLYRTIIISILVFLPYPFMFAIFWQAYSAPKELLRYQTGIGKRRDSASIKDAKIRSMSLPILYFGMLMLTLGISIDLYNIYSNKDEHANYLPFYIIFLVICLIAINIKREFKL